MVRNVGGYSHRWVECTSALVSNLESEGKGHYKKRVTDLKAALGERIFQVVVIKELNWIIVVAYSIQEDKTKKENVRCVT